jgi:ribosomal 30S subunit maturation factor RimM
MAVSMGLDLVGLVVFSREGTKLGKLTDVISDGGAAAEYLVISRFLARDLVIPADVVEMPDHRVVVPFSDGFLACAPVVKAKGAVSSEDRGRLEAFYHAGATED